MKNNKNETVMYATKINKDVTHEVLDFYKIIYEALEKGECRYTITESNIINSPFTKNILSEYIKTLKKEDSSGYNARILGIKPY